MFAWHSNSSWLAVCGDQEAALHLLQRTARGDIVYATSWALPSAARCLACSPCGRRLCIGLTQPGALRGLVWPLRGAHSLLPYAGLVAVADWTQQRLHPVGYIHGAEGSGVAQLIRFKQASSFLLCTILWSSGVLSFVPMFV